MSLERRWGAAGLGLVLAAMLAPSGASFAADAQNGLSLAHRWCEACHVIAPRQSRSSTDGAPPFAAIAARPDFDSGRLALFLLEPHPKMPNMSLTRSEAADLAAFIAALK